MWLADRAIFQGWHAAHVFPLDDWSNAETTSMLDVVTSTAAFQHPLLSVLQHSPVRVNMLEQKDADTVMKEFQKLSQNRGFEVNAYL